MHLRDTIIWSVSITLAAVLLITAGLQLDYINSERYQMKLIINEPLENAPPSLAFATVAMGAFRGLVVDILWLRADRLKEQGQFFDAKQIAEWITTLQPRFASVWEFHSWNMAYNISVAIPANQPQERWRWVKNGYELLRDEGIPLNPKSMSLYQELARIFQHKIGSVSDEAHKYYKLQLATSMEPLLGSTDNEFFQMLAEAPEKWSQIIEDPNTANFVAAMKNADKAFDDDDEFVSNYLTLRHNPKRFEPEAFKVIDIFRGTKVLEKFDIFAKAWYLRTVWKLDPVLMQEINQTYGPVHFNDPNNHLPLDWRHPDTHAIYWAVKGLKTAGKGEFSVGEANTDRTVGHSLQNLFYNGKIFIYNIPQDPNADRTEQKATKEVFLRPDLGMFEPCNNARLATLKKYEEIGRHDTYVSFQQGHRNVLRNAVLLFYQAGHYEKAGKIYNQLRELYPSEEVKVPLVQFARNFMFGKLQNIGLSDAKRNVQMLLRESYFRYALRDDDEAFGREKMAEEVHRYYQSAYLDENRINLPDFKLLRYFALLDFFNDYRYPLNLRQSLLGRIKVERPDLAEQLKHVELQLMEQKPNE
ncbi:MAG: hypothetical protein MUO22_02580 [Sedimentisphaerales bacterium]|nr:hypothetical protein [Sedimentisphaerales bacterium]